ncbi:lytic murein transglycosylase family protein [Rhodospirillum centenum]|uniref:Lytic murein transglycosylase family protein n=1 Tax=Rhodospirillum centenum (strain ATCC 51521 / SW) TaxID=414684 RepID=B6IQA6_RHOCS|nr:lytic murein transglycosylase family protein [Rhodospirillum centenum]ACI97642.1 lytic murein transglycosylase family protein [Rhodospirillum centenum SW]
MRALGEVGATRRIFVKRSRRRLRRLLLLAALLGLGLVAPGWALSEPAILPATAPERLCLDAIRKAERAHRLPSRLLLALGVTESGRTVDGRLTVWPWTVNAEGQGRFFKSREEALTHVRALRARGVRSIDVGCLQVNLHWHPDAFPDLETALDPAANVGYAAALLKNLHGDLRNWTRSVKHYHSRTPERGEAYFDRVSENMRLVAQRRRDLADAPPTRQRTTPTPGGTVVRPVTDSLSAWRLPKAW